MSRRGTPVALAFALASFACHSAPAFAKPGPVVGFGVDANDRAVVMLRAEKASKPVIARFTADGTLDPTFAGDGILRPPVSGVGARLAVQAGGGILVGGKRGKTVVVLRHYRPDGSPDRRFGDGGRLRLRYGQLERVLVQPSGTIVVLATLSCSPGSCGYLYRNLDILRYSRSGRHLRSYRLSKESWQLTSAGVGADGSFVLSGLVWDLEYVTYDRFLPSGAYDRPFHVKLALQSANEEWSEEAEPSATAIAIQPDGKLVISSGYGPELWRRHPSGRADFAFGQSGRTLCGLPLGAEDIFAPGPSFADVTVAPEGKLVAAGGEGECGLVRYLPDGTPDLSFGGDGTIDVEGMGMSRPQALSLLPDGAVLVAGWNPTASVFRLGRYTADGVLDPGFGTAGIASLAVDLSG